MIVDDETDRKVSSITKPDENVPSPQILFRKHL